MNARDLGLGVALAVVMGCGSSSQTPMSVSAKATEVAAAADTTSTPLDLGNGIVLQRVRVVVRKLILGPASTPTDAGTVTPATCDASNCCCTDSTGNHVLCRDADLTGVTAAEREHDYNHQYDHDYGGGGGYDHDYNHDYDHDYSYDSDLDGQAADHLILGPLLVDLSATTLAGGIAQIFSGTIPDGTYEELKLVIGPITVAEAGTDEKLLEMANQNASIIVEGTVDGTPFTFVSSLTAEFDVDASFVVSGGAVTNLTLSMDVKNWFTYEGGRCDPIAAQERARIENRIRAAIHAFQDDDRNGCDDHHGNQLRAGVPCGA